MRGDNKEEQMGNMRMVVFCTAAVVAGSVGAQTFPSKPIRIVTADPGGAFDFEARLISQGVSGSVGQQVIVENRGGANGILAGQTMTKSPPDGYSLLYYGSTVWLQPYMRDDVPYDPVKDFAPITLAVISPGLIVVNPALPVNSVKTLIALSKARPGALNYGTGGTGGANHLAAELFKLMAGVEIVRIPYKGAAAAVTDVIGGKLELMFPIMASAVPHVRSGRLKALAVTSAQRSTVLPELPTVAESGLPGYEAVQMSGMFAPARTPEAVISRLNQEITAVLTKPENRQRLLNVGSEVIASPPPQLATAMKADMDRMSRVIKAAAIRSE